MLNKAQMKKMQICEPDKLSQELVQRIFNPGQVQSSLMHDASAKRAIALRPCRGLAGLGTTTTESEGARCGRAFEARLSPSLSPSNDAADVRKANPRRNCGQLGTVRGNEQMTEKGGKLALVRKENTTAALFYSRPVTQNGPMVKVGDDDDERRFEREIEKFRTIALLDEREDEERERGIFFPPLAKNQYPTLKRSNSSTSASTRAVTTQKEGYKNKGKLRLNLGDIRYAADGVLMQNSQLNLLLTAENYYGSFYPQFLRKSKRRLDSPRVKYRKYFEESNNDLSPDGRVNSRLRSLLQKHRPHRTAPNKELETFNNYSRPLTVSLINRSPDIGKESDGEKLSKEELSTLTSESLVKAAPSQKNIRKRDSDNTNREKSLHLIGTGSTNKSQQKLRVRFNVDADIREFEPHSPIR